VDIVYAGFGQLIDHSNIVNKDDVRRT